MTELQAQDALHEQVRCVAKGDRPAQVRLLSETDALYAVFSEEYPGSRTAEQFLGFVTHHQASRHPDRSFGELLNPAAWGQVSASASAEELVWKLSDGTCETLAVFDDSSRFVGAVTPGTLLVAQLRQAADIQEKLRLYRKSVLKDKRRREEWSSRLEQINLAFRKLMGLLVRPSAPELFQRGIETLSVLLDASYGAVVILDSRGQPKESILAGMTPGNDIKTFLRHRKPLLDRILSQRTGLRIDDVGEYLEGLGENVGRRSMHSFLGVPIEREEQCFGCVYLCDKEEGEPFTSDDEILAASFAGALALVLAQARDRAERKRAEQERELLARLGLQLSVVTTVDGIGTAVAEMTKALCRWDSFALAVRRSGLTRFHYATRLSDTGTAQPTENPAEFDISQSPGYDQLRNGQAVLRLENRGSAASTLIAPVWAENEIVAVLILSRETEPELTETDRVFLKRVADTIGPAVARCRAEARNAAFLTLASRLTMVRTPPEAARVIVVTADELFGWDSCSVALYYEEKNLGALVLHYDLVEGIRTEFCRPPDILPPGRVAQKVMREGPLLILRDDSNTHVAGLETLGDLSRRSLSLMFVPLRLENQIVGVFSIQSYTPYAYTEKDLEILQALGDLCAGALERTRPADPVAPEAPAQPKTRSRAPRKKE